LPKLFISLVIISNIVVAIGLLKNDVAVIVDSMVIAPLLGPFVGLSLASVLGDFELMKESLPMLSQAPIPSHRTCKRPLWD